MLQVTLSPMVPLETGVWLLGLIPQQLQSLSMLSFGLVEDDELAVLAVVQ